MEESFPSLAIPFEFYLQAFRLEVNDMNLLPEISPLQKPILQYFSPFSLST